MRAHPASQSRHRSPAWQHRRGAHCAVPGANGGARRIRGDHHRSAPRLRDRGNRSAREWILDQYKDKKPGDPTVREKFNTYHFAGYKEKAIDLLMRLTRVSATTQIIVEAMRETLR